MNRAQLLAHIQTLPMSGDPREDAELSIFMALELEVLLARAYDVKRPNLKMANGEVIPIDTSISNGAESFSYHQFDGVGIAKFTNGYAIGDMPRVDISGKKFTAPFESLTAAFGWSLNELRNAQLVRRPLSKMKAERARRAHDEAWNRVGLFGSSEHGMRGLINHPNITVTDAPDGAGASPLWSLKTPDEIIADVNTMIRTVRDITNGVEEIVKVWVPIDQFGIIEETPRSDTSDTTILEFLMKTHKGVTFEWINELAAAKSFGNLTVDAMFGATGGNDTALMVSQPFETSPIQQDGFDFKVGTHSRIGGVRMPYPLGYHRVDGI